MSFTSRAQKSGFTLTPALTAILHDGNFYALMVGAGESYLIPFAIFLAASPLQLAVITSLPPFVGALGQMAGLFTLRFLPSRRTLIVWSVACNAAIWLFIAAIPFMFGSGSAAAWALMSCLLLYYGSASVGGPAWNSLVGDIVPDDTRGNYFGFRNRYIGLFTFIAVVAAGQVLDLTTRIHIPTFGYLFIFSFAAVSRFISCRWLTRYDDPPHVFSPSDYFSFARFIMRMPWSNFARFVLYISIINCAVAFSAPFFTLYMLRDLKLSYLEFTAASAASIVVQFLTMQYWGKLVDTFGSKKILNIMGFGIVIAPLTWLFCTKLWYIVLIQFYNGFVWAGFNLAAATFLFDAVTPAKRARCTAYQAVVNGVFVFAGAVLGGKTAGIAPESISFFGFTWVPASSLFFVFIGSAILRLAASMILLPRFKEVSEVEPIRHRQLLFRVTGMRPIAGLSFGIFSGEEKTHSGIRRRFLARIKARSNSPR